MPRNPGHRASPNSFKPTIRVGRLIPWRIERSHEPRSYVFYKDVFVEKLYSLSERKY